MTYNIFTKDNVLMRLVNDLTDQRFKSADIDQLPLLLGPQNINLIDTSYLSEKKVIEESNSSNPLPVIYINLAQNGQEFFLKLPEQIGRRDAGEHTSTLLKIIKSKKGPELISSIRKVFESQGQQKKQNQKKPDKILLIDDENDICNVLKEVFLLEGVECLTAKNLVEVLDVFQTHSISTIISDVFIPEFDGPEIISLVTSVVTPAPEVIYISAYANSSVIKQYKSVTPKLLAKPFEFEALRTVINSLKTQTTA